jgi:hypothetical protein
MSMTKEEMIAAIRRHNELEARVPECAVVLGEIQVQETSTREVKEILPSYLTADTKARIVDLVVADLKRQAEAAAEPLRAAGVQVN